MPNRPFRPFHRKISWQNLARELVVCSGLVGSRQVAGHIDVNLTMTVDDFDGGEFFKQGGRFAVVKVFGKGLVGLLSELNVTLGG